MSYLMTIINIKNLNFMTQGTIKRLTDKGFGFIAQEGEDKDLFFHSNDVNGDYDDLKEGQEVSFSVEEGQKGLNAVDVTVA
jgi:CspA family cold shock protein